MLMQNTLGHNYPIMEWNDYFAGCGGGTSSIKEALFNGEKVCRVKTALNHWPTAIKSHTHAHPEVHHITDDIRKFNPYNMPKYTEGVWTAAVAGVDCTFHSGAKGGASRDSDSRALAEELPAYVGATNPAQFVVENVKEFKNWGPLIPKVMTFARKGKKKGKKIKVANEVMVAFSEMDENENWKLYQNDGNIYFSALEKNMVEIPGKKKKRQNGVKWWMIPHPFRKGEYYRAWLKEMHEAGGYWSDDRLLVSADFGGRTIRKRLFVQFAKIGMPIEWPKPTHNKKGTGGLKKWLAVKPLLDLDDEGYSIFGREYRDDIPKKNRKPYGEETLERIFNGVLKIVLKKSEEEFICKAMGNQMDGQKSNGKSINDPSLAVTAQNRMNIVKVIKEDKVLLKWFGNRKEDLDKCTRSLKDPAYTVVVQNRLGMFSVTTEPEERTQQEELEFIMTYHGSGDNTKGVDEPAFTVASADVMAKIKTEKEFITDFNSSSTQKGLNEPAQTIKTKDGLAKVKTDHFIDIHFSSGKQSQPLEEPIGGIVGNPKQKLVTAKRAFITQTYSGDPKNKVKSIEDPARAVTATAGNQNLTQAFILDGNYGNPPKTVDDPAPTVMASRHHHYIVDTQYDNAGKSINEPAQTLIAQMGKKPPYLVNVETGEVNIIIYEDDSPMTKKLKILMATYGIVDIKMRMLKVTELLQIQGFRKNTKLYGNQGDQKKQIGNSIERFVFKALVEAMYNARYKHEKQLKLAA